MIPLDLMGKKYNRLKVLCKAPHRNGHTMWTCECDCGKIVDVQTSKLVGNTTKSCGCHRRDVTIARNKAHPTKGAGLKYSPGQKFGRLTMIRPMKKKPKIYGWVCRCDCGNEIFAMTSSLTSGQTQSCGCLQRERASITGKLRNRGLSTESQLFRKSIPYIEWRRAVFSRDGWKCAECGKSGIFLHAHHIKSFSKHPELRLDVDNGITLCPSCHQGKHRSNHAIKGFGKRQNRRPELALAI